jgi:hypothetical protein
MTKLCGFSKCLSIISFSVAFALLPAPSFALSNYKEPGWDASYTVTKTSTNTYNIHITPTSPPDKDIGIYIETGNSSTLQFSDGTRSTLLGSGGVSGTSYDYSFISTDSNYLIEFYNNTNGGFRYISPTETFPTTTPVVSNPAIVRCSDFSSSGHPLDDIRAHVPGFDSSTYGWISICDLDSQGNITLREFIVTAQPDLHLMKWIGALNNPTYPCIQLPGETWSIGYDSTGHHSIDSHLFGSSLVCPYQGGNISYDDSNVTDVDPSFTNAGYTVPQRKVPIPDYSNTMTMSFSLSDKHLEYWNTTPN